jgi:hypothetical protein
MNAKPNLIIVVGGLLALASSHSAFGQRPAEKPAPAAVQHNEFPGQFRPNGSTAAAPMATLPRPTAPRAAMPAVTRAATRVAAAPPPEQEGTAEEQRQLQLLRQKCVLGMPLDANETIFLAHWMTAHPPKLRRQVVTRRIAANSYDN